MKVLGISWAGVRAGDFDAAVRFFSEAVGLPLRMRSDEEEIAVFRLASGDLFEIFGPNNPESEMYACPVFAFQVDDIISAREEMESRGIEFVTKISSYRDQAWCNFRGPDGHLFEIKQTRGYGKDHG